MAVAQPPGILVHDHIITWLALADTGEVKTDRKNPSRKADFAMVKIAKGRKTPSTSMRTSSFQRKSFPCAEHRGRPPLAAAEEQPNATNTHLTRPLGPP